MAIEQSGPKKPSAPLVGVAFSDAGKVRMIVEPPLATNKNDLERLIVDRFLAALHSDLGLKIGQPSRPMPPPDWPDFEVSIEDRVVGIELVGAIHPPHAIAWDV